MSVKFIDFTAPKSILHVPKIYAGSGPWPFVTRPGRK